MISVYALIINELCILIFAYSMIINELQNGKKKAKYLIINMIAKIYIFLIYIYIYI